MANILHDAALSHGPGTDAVNEFTLCTPLIAVARRGSNPLQVDKLPSVSDRVLMGHALSENHLRRMRSAGGPTGILVYCADYRCSHSIDMPADQWPDDVRLSDIEPRFVCKERSCLDRYFDELCEAANLRDVDVRKTSSLSHLTDSELWYQILRIDRRKEWSFKLEAGLRVC
jgi:hypothetical protein